jgi:hypothetical protein
MANLVTIRKGEIRFDFLPAAPVRSTIFLDVPTCSLVEIHQRYQEIGWPHLQIRKVAKHLSDIFPAYPFARFVYFSILKMEAIRSVVLRT